MKRLFSGIVALLMIITLIFPLNIDAASGITIYNCGEKVPLKYKIKEYDNKKYIHSDDLEKINLAIDFDSIYGCGSQTEMTLCPGSSAVTVNGTMIFYKNAALELENERYISLDLLAMFFSKMYDENDNRISLWISEYEDDFIRGIAALPSGETAPEGGASVNVFAANPKIIAGNVPSGKKDKIEDYSYTIGKPGYGTEFKPMYDNEYGFDNSFLNYKRIASANIVIPEGKNSVEYTLSADGMNFCDCVIGYCTEFEGTLLYDMQKYTDANRLYNFVIDNKKVAVNGKITLPYAAKSDMKFTVAAKGKLSYRYEGIIKAGSGSVDYSICVAQNNSYEIVILFENGEYMRSTKAVTVGEEAVYNADFNMTPAEKYNVTLAIPGNGKAKNDIHYTVYLQSAIEPDYILDVCDGIIPSGDDSSKVCLFDDLDCGGVICFYTLNGNHDGLFDYGHFSGANTSFDVNNSQIITTAENEVVIPLLKSKDISVNCSLPNGDVALEDIYIDLLPNIINDDSDTANFENMPVQNNPNIYSSADRIKIPVIRKNESNGNKILSLPDEKGYEFDLICVTSGGAGKYYDLLYYNWEKPTVLRERASIIDNKTDSIGIELQRQYKVSGTIDALGFNGGHNCININSVELSPSGNLYGKFSKSVDISDERNYTVFVPEEFDAYTVELSSSKDGKSIFYGSKGVTRLFCDENIILIDEDKDDVDFIYGGYKPSLPIEVYTKYDSTANGRKIILKNISDFDIPSAEVNVCMYDENGRLLEIVRNGAENISAGLKTDSGIIAAEDKLTDSSIVKVLIWDSMKPLSKPYFIKNNAALDFDEKKLASLYLSTESNRFYVNGDEHQSDITPVIFNDVMYAPVRILAESLGWNVGWSAETSEISFYNDDITVLLKIGSTEMYVNNEKTAKINPPLVINDRTMLPIADVVSNVGYVCCADNAAETLAVFDKTDWRVKCAFDNGLITRECVNSTFTDRLTRLQLASLIVNAYEKYTGKTIDMIENPYNDCMDSNAIKAYVLELMNGYEDGGFKPNETVMHSEFIRVLYNLLVKLNVQFPKNYDDTDEFDDYSKNYAEKHWAGTYVYRLKAAGVLDGVFDKTISIDNSTSVREAAAMLFNGCELIEK